MRCLHNLHESLREVLKLERLLSFLIQAGSRAEEFSFGFLEVLRIVRYISLALHRVARNLFSARFFRPVGTCVRVLSLALSHLFLQRVHTLLQVLGWLTGRRSICSWLLSIETQQEWHLSLLLLSCDRAANIVHVILSTLLEVPRQRGTDLRRRQLALRSSGLRR